MYIKIDLKSGLGLLGTALLGIGYAGYRIYKMHRTEKEMNAAIERISQQPEFSVDESMLNAAIERAANRQVEQEMAKARETVIASIRSDMERSVQDAVSKEWDEVKKEVTPKLMEKAQDIDVEKWRGEIKKKAEETVIQQIMDIGGLPKAYRNFIGAFNGGGIMDTDQLVKVLSQFGSSWDKKEALGMLTGHRGRI